MADRPRLCIFGDSHYACIRQAELQGLVDVRGVELEYWGHVGTRFRHLEFRDGAIHPLDDFTARRFAKFNARGRTFLPPADFDAILVMGARVYVWRLFFRLLQRLAEGPFFSSGLQRRVLADGLRGQLGYQLAAGLAATRTAQVILAPVAYYTEDTDRSVAPGTAGMAGLMAERLPGFWSVLTEVAAEDGITLLSQPQETVVAGMFTDPAYAVADHVERQDYEHHNAAYGAVVLARALDRLRQGGIPGQGLRLSGAPGRMAAGTEG